MANSSPGPRDYTQATERALFAFSGTKCYYPDCEEPVLKFVSGEPVGNVQIAHIHGAKEGSPRYVKSMSDDERRAFKNLVLLCTPHHTWVDRLHPNDYPADVLAEWKRKREVGIDSAALSSLTEERLLEVIAEAVASAGPQRSVSAELGLGVLMESRGALVTLPVEAARRNFELLVHEGPAVLAVTARNTGSLKAYVESYRIRLDPCGFNLTFMGELPQHNSALPCPLDVGEHRTWVIPHDSVMRAVLTTLAADPGGVAALVGEISLGSGETVATPELPVEYLGEPMPADLVQARESTENESRPKRTIFAWPR